MKSVKKAFLPMMLLLSLSAGSTVLAQPVESTDFEFTPPSFPREVGGQVFQYFLPAADGFAANVNLQIQPYEGSLEDYEALSVQQFEQLDFEMIDLARGDNELVFEYTGSMQGTEFHWFSRVLKEGNYFYVVTATALAERWDTEREALVESVDSFRL
ncbi:hypothetical protein CWE12_00345 [Aliidiomarina sedimenti]|uniref:DUF1795 domain-containing protein n=1 Tax=Aliidiomarina sedimenti TaxID=1933879 RepID=A0ABY0C134_9GAMM|nr:hypothetical protein [Aliidiomarina sedimenti]RUO31488.1 hypothetical protein CWE12_00345 [Aliidiomarina sedimenti]